MESPRKMSVQKRPTARQIQPTGFLGCLEVIRAPTMGKARKERKINSSLRVSPVLVGSCDEWARTCSTRLARNMATQRPASGQASQEAVRVLIALTLRSCSLALFSLHHSTAPPSPKPYQVESSWTPEAREKEAEKGMPVNSTSLPVGAMPI